MQKAGQNGKSQLETLHSMLAMPIAIALCLPFNVCGRGNILFEEIRLLKLKYFILFILWTDFNDDQNKCLRIFIC